MPGFVLLHTIANMILFHGPKQSLVPTQLAKGMMAVRRRLTSDLPPDRKIRSLAVVRICRDRGEYLTYGGSPASVGYFNPGCGELVLYDARTDPVGAIPPDHRRRDPRETHRPKGHPLMSPTPDRSLHPPTASPLSHLSIPPLLPRHVP